MCIPTLLQTLLVPIGGVGKTFVVKHSTKKYEINHIYRKEEVLKTPSLATSLTCVRLFFKDL